MSEKTTPIEAAAMAGGGAWAHGMQDAHVPHLWRHISAAVITAALDAVDLEAVLRAHRLSRWEVSGADDGPDMVTLVCACRLEFVMEEGVPDGAEAQLEAVHENHQADMQRAALLEGSIR